MNIKVINYAFSIVIACAAQQAQASGACAPQVGYIDDSSGSYVQSSGYSNGVWHIWGDWPRPHHDITISLSTPLRIKFQDNISVAYDLEGPAGKIYRLYSMFNKKPDAAGLGYWINDANNCQTIEQIAVSFMGTSEYASTYGVNSTNASFLTTLYNNVFRKSPDTDGFNYWMGRLNEGMPRVAVILSFTENDVNKAYIYPDIGRGIGYLPYGGASGFKQSILKSPF